MTKPVIETYLVSGNITIFCGVHSNTFKNDILYSSLLGQLVAAKEGNDRELSWSSHVDTIKKIGWVINSREFQRCEFGTTSLLNIVKKVGSAVLPYPEQQALADVISGLKKLPFDSLVTRSIIEKLQANVFVASARSESIPATKSSASTAVLLTIVRTDKTVVTLQISFETTHAIDINILNQPVLKPIADAKTNIRLLCSSLDERQYTPIRDSIIKKLGGRIETDLLQVPAPLSLN